MWQFLSIIYFHLCVAQTIVHWFPKWKLFWRSGCLWEERGEAVRRGCCGYLVQRGNISKARRKNCQINFSPFQSHPREFLSHFTSADLAALFGWMTWFSFPFFSVSSNTVEDHLIISPTQWPSLSFLSCTHRSELTPNTTLAANPLAGPPSASAPEYLAVEGLQTWPSYTIVCMRNQTPSLLNTSSDW